MKRIRIPMLIRPTALLFLGFASATLTTATPRSIHPVKPLAKAHAHNDYEHERPLHDALSQGFTSVEADVHLFGNQLLVAHSARDAQASKTLQSLYLEPLQNIIRENKGSVYSENSRFTLFVDIKTEGEETYQAIEAALEQYKKILTSSTRETSVEGPVTVIISGNRPRETMRAQNIRHTFYDGRLADLDTNSDARFIPIISDNWEKTFSWKGDGDMPSNERAKLIEIVTKAHRNHQRVRFWATPDEPSTERAAVWLELLHAGVDLINTDDLAGLKDFLIENDRR